MAETQDKDHKPQPVLSLDTLVERRFITINGTPYTLVNDGELSILDYHRLGKRAAKVEALWGRVELTDEEVTELTEALDWLCRLVLDAPPEVHDKLLDQHRLQVVMAFTNLHRKTTPLAGGRKPEEAPPAPPSGESSSESPTGEKSSQG